MTECEQNFIWMGERRELKAEHKLREIFSQLLSVQEDRFCAWVSYTQYCDIYIYKSWTN